MRTNDRCAAGLVRRIDREVKWPKDASKVKRDATVIKRNENELGLLQLPNSEHARDSNWARDRSRVVEGGRKRTRKRKAVGSEEEARACWPKPVDGECGRNVIVKEWDAGKVKTRRRRIKEHDQEGVREREKKRGEKRGKRKNRSKRVKRKRVSEVTATETNGDRPREKDGNEWKWLSCECLIRERERERKRGRMMMRKWHPK